MALKRYFLSSKFDIVHTHSSKTGILGRLAASSAGVPIIFHTVQGLPFHEFSPSPLKIFYSLFEKKAGEISNKVIFVNQEERELAIEKQILPENKTVTIYNGVNLDTISKFKNDNCRREFRTKWGIAEDDFVVGYVGRLWEQKDPETLLRTIELCIDLPVRFLIVGDGPYKHHFDKKFQGNDQVILTGWLDDPMVMYPAIDVLMLPSLWEGLSVTLIEGMAFGKPLIATDIKGNRECVWDGDNGFLCPPRTPGVFRKCIKTLIDDNELYRRMSLAGQEKAAELFDATTNSRMVIDLYEKEIALTGK